MPRPGLANDWKQSLARNAYLVCFSVAFILPHVLALSYLTEVFYRFKRGKNSWIPVKKNMPTLYNDGVLYMFDGNLFSTSFEGDTSLHTTKIHSKRVANNKLPSIQQALKYIDEVQAKSLSE